MIKSGTILTRFDGCRGDLLMIDAKIGSRFYFKRKGIESFGYLNYGDVVVQIGSPQLDEHAHVIMMQCVSRFGVGWAIAAHLQRMKENDEAPAR